MAMSDEIKEQTVKLKDMTTKEKADYIWTYYKFWIIGMIATVFIVTSVTKTIINNSKPVYLDAMFLNSKCSGSYTECTLMDEYIDAVGIDMAKYNINFDYVTYLNDDYGNQASYAGQVKVMSKYSSEQLDIMCGPQSVLSGSADVGGYMKLEEILSEDKIKELENKGYEFYYYTEKITEDDAQPDADGNIPYKEGETYMAGIYLDNCSRLVGNAASTVYEAGLEDRPVLTVTWNTKNIDHAVEFIDFVTK